ncbi:MAG TPA: excinuclease ABC subunit C, partial [Ferruginibacter sp.]|nr:excinuclease ABC subunit C [Ferruginibacter sp.]
VPKSGDKKKLLVLSEKNVNYFRQDLMKRKMLNLDNKSVTEKTGVLKQLQKDLQLSSIPLHIECFDNSNLQGSYPVSAMVCFINGQPNRAAYRRYKVKTVVGINDFASMEEVVYRRYKKLTTENEPLPQLVIIDGGKGQLSSAMKSITTLGLQSSITVIGLAKNEEEIFFSGDTQSVKLPWDSDSLKLIRRIRDEVHKHGITYHRNLRSKGTFVNELEQINGIGKNTANVLLKKFKSVKNIKDKTLQELETVIGKSKAVIIHQHFKGI